MFSVCHPVFIVTVILHVACFPLFDFATIEVVPAPTAVTFPSFTVATFELLVVHVIFLFAASVGVIVAFKVICFPFSIVALVLFKLTFDTATSSCVTVTFITTDILPADATISVDPFFTPVTFPSFTVAIEVFLLVHAGVCTVAFVGVIVAFKVSLAPTFKESDDLLTVKPVTGITLSLTTTLHVAVFPLLVLPVIVASPFFIPVTFPSFTVATDVLLLDQVIVLFVAFVGAIIAFIDEVFPSSSAIEVLLKVKLVTGILSSFVTVTLSVATGASE